MIFKEYDGNKHYHLVWDQDPDADEFFSLVATVVVPKGRHRPTFYIRHESADGVNKTVQQVSFQNLTGLFEDLKNCKTARQGAAKLLRKFREVPKQGA